LVHEVVFIRRAVFVELQSAFIHVPSDRTIHGEGIGAVGVQGCGTPPEVRHTAKLTHSPTLNGGTAAHTSLQRVRGDVPRRLGIGEGNRTAGGKQAGRVTPNNNAAVIEIADQPLGRGLVGLINRQAVDNAIVRQAGTTPDTGRVGERLQLDFLQRIYLRRIEAPLITGIAQRVQRLQLGIPHGYQGVIVVATIRDRAHPDLMQIVLTGGHLSPGFSGAQGRQQDGRQNGDDGNDHQQFNQGETAKAALTFIIIITKTHTSHSTLNLPRKSATCNPKHSQKGQGGKV